MSFQTIPVTCAARWRRAPLGLALAGALVVSGACSSSTDEASTKRDEPIGDVDLSGDCPATVVVQLDWNPSAEQGALWQLLGPDYSVDTDSLTVTGPLYSKGEYTGVNLELRAGGPAIGFQSVTSQMYVDDSILLGSVDLDASVQNAESNPTTAVFATLDVSPQIIFWDPGSHPDVHGIADLGTSGTPVFYYADSAYLEYLIGAGILDRDQVNSGYDGTPAAFVASSGENAQQGFATSEPFEYEHEVENWGEPVDYQLVSETGYPTYTSALAVRSDDLQPNSACLKELVPVLQQATVDYLSDPEAANEAIVSTVEQFDNGFVYESDLADYAVDTMRDLHIMGDGGDGIIGNFDVDRVQQLIDITTPIFTDEGIDLPADLEPGDVATDEFIDPSISLGS